LKVVNFALDQEMRSNPSTPRVIVIGSGIGGLTTAALLARDGYDVTVLEAQSYPGGSASTFYHKGYRFESGATLAGGFQPNGPHALVGDMLDMKWPVHPCEPAWVVHLPDREVALTRDNADVLRKFPETESFWEQQGKIADLGWSLSAQGLPWPPSDFAELLQIARVGLSNFPRDLQAVPFALSSVYQWLERAGLASNKAFVRFIDAQLLISAQTTSKGANAMYGATALDLARQGVFHVEGGIGGLAETLVDKIEALGGRVLFKQRATGIRVDNDRVNGVYVKRGRRGKEAEALPCDFLVANVTPWSLDQLLGEFSPAQLRQEVSQRAPGWGAFVLHLGLDAQGLPADFPDHHQVIVDYDSPLGETKSIFISMSPDWDKTRAPEGQRAVTMTTHTAVQPWWDLLKQDFQAYQARKDEYTEKILTAVDKAIPGFRARVKLLLPGTPVTYNFYTDRHLGMVGGFPQTSLFKARGPRTGIANLRLVGDSIFPGQSTAGVSLGGIRVADDARRFMPLPKARTYHQTQLTESSRP
jgi:C-3',4' desaturase CrtD